MLSGVLWLCLWSVVSIVLVCCVGIYSLMWLLFRVMVSRLLWWVILLFFVGVFIFRVCSVLLVLCKFMWS